jgi:hypothetical protein
MKKNKPLLANWQERTNSFCFSYLDLVLRGNMASHAGHIVLILSPNGPGAIAGAEKTSHTVSFEASERPKWADFSPYADRCHHFPPDQADRQSGPESRIQAISSQTRAPGVKFFWHFPPGQAGDGG